MAPCLYASFIARVPLLNELWVGREVLLASKTFLNMQGIFLLMQRNVLQDVSNDCQFLWVMWHVSLVVFLPCVWRELHLSIVRLFWKRKNMKNLNPGKGVYLTSLFIFFWVEQKRCNSSKQGVLCKIGWGRKKDAVFSNMQNLMMKIMIEGTTCCDTIFISSLINYIVVETWKIKTCWSSTKSKSMPFI